ncbi:unnamed protein product, partial [Urochloa humidicola]
SRSEGKKNVIPFFHRQYIEISFSIFLVLSCCLLALRQAPPVSQATHHAQPSSLSAGSLSTAQWVRPPVKQRQRARPRGSRPPVKQRRRGRDPAPGAAAEAGFGAGSLASSRRPARAAAVPRAEDTTADGSGIGITFALAPSERDCGANLGRQRACSRARSGSPTPSSPHSARYNARRAVSRALEHETQP